MARGNHPVDITFIIRVTFTGMTRTLIDQALPGERPPEAVHYDLLHALSSLDSLLGSIQPRKDNVWVSEDTPGTLYVQYDTQEGSKVHVTIVDLKRRCGGSKAFFDNPISYLAVYQIPTHSSNHDLHDDRLLFALKRLDPVRAGNSTLTYASPSFYPPAMSQSTSSSLISYPALPVPVPLTVHYNSAGTSSLPTAPPSLPLTPAETAIMNQNKMAGSSGSDSSPSITNRWISAARRIRAQTSPTFTTAGVFSKATNSKKFPTGAPLLAIKARTPGELSSSKSSGRTASKKFAFPAARQTDAHMAMSTSGSAASTLAQPISKRVEPARHSAEPPTAGKQTEPAASSMATTASTRGDQLLHLPSALPAAGPSAKPAAPFVSAAAKTPVPALEQPALGLSPATAGMPALSGPSQDEKTSPIPNEGAPVPFPPARAPGAVGATPQAAESTSGTSEAEALAKRKRMQAGIRKILEAERAKHNKELDIVKKNHAELLKAERMKHIQQLKTTKKEHTEQLVTVQAQCAEEVHALQAHRDDLEEAIQSAEGAVTTMKQELADVSKRAEVKMTEFRRAYKRQLIEELAKTRQELDLARRDADARGKEVVGMKRKSTEIAGRLVRMRTEGAMSPAPVTTEHDEGNIIDTVSSLETYIQGMRSTLQSEISSRQALERELRILKDVGREHKEPFVVPALLEAFVRLSQLGDGDGRG